MKINSKKEIEGARIELETSLSWDDFAKFEKEAIEKLKKEIKIDGFREGAVPTDLVVKNVGDMGILMEMADLAINTNFPAVLKESKIDAIGNPEIKINKIARGNPLEITIILSVMPEIKLPDYKKIAKEINKSKETPTATEAEVQKAIDDILKMRAHQMHHEHSHKDGEKCDHKEDELALPELNDEFVKSVGPFESVADFKDKVASLVKENKEREVKEKNRIALLNEIFKDVNADFPAILINQEIERMKNEIKAHIESIGGNFAEYLKYQNKTEEDLNKEFLKDAIERIKVEIGINEIAKAEKLSPNKEKFEQEVDELMKRHPDIEKIRIQAYVADKMIKSDVMEFLENL